MNYKKYIAIKVSSYLNLSIEKIENSIVTPSDIKNEINHQQKYHLI